MCMGTQRGGSVMRKASQQRKTLKAKADKWKGRSAYRCVLVRTVPRRLEEIR